jgi:hypothetical protein
MVQMPVACKEDLAVHSWGCYQDDFCLLKKVHVVIENVLDVDLVLTFHIASNA